MELDFDAVRAFLYISLLLLPFLLAFIISSSSLLLLTKGLCLSLSCTDSPCSLALTPFFFFSYFFLLLTCHCFVVPTHRAIIVPLANKKISDLK